MTRRKRIDIGVTDERARTTPPSVGRWRLIPVFTTWFVILPLHASIEMAYTVVSHRPRTRTDTRDHRAGAISSQAARAAVAATAPAYPRRDS